MIREFFTFSRRTRAERQYQIDLAERIQDADLQKEHLRKSGDSWDFGFGNYNHLYANITDGRYTWQEVMRASVEDINMLGVEGFLYKNIQKLLTKEIGRPVIAIDFGGGAGLSFIRLAKKFEDAVERGRLKLLITNLGRIAFAQGMRYQSELSDGDKENHEFIARNAHLVQYMQADARELKEAQIVADGRVLGLLGNVDIIHECMALRHSTIGDVDIPALGELLSPCGILMLKSQCAEGQPPTAKISTARRTSALERGIQQLAQTSDIQKFNTDQMLAYSIFTKGDPKDIELPAQERDRPPEETR